MKSDEGIPLNSAELEGVTANLALTQEQWRQLEELAEKKGMTLVQYFNSEVLGGEIKEWDEKEVAILKSWSLKRRAWHILKFRVLMPVLHPLFRSIQAIYWKRRLNRYIKNRGPSLYQANLDDLPVGFYTSGDKYRILLTRIQLEDESRK